MTHNTTFTSLTKTIGLLFLAIFLSVGAFAQADHLTGDTPAEPGDNAPLPEFELTKRDGVILTKDGLIKNRPVIVFYFEPDCDHCQQQAIWIVEKIMEFKGTQLLWITWGELEAMGGFADKYFGGGARSIQFGKDINYQFDNWFGYSEVPSIYVYNAQWQRIAAFKHETKAENILEVLGK